MKPIITGMLLLVTLFVAAPAKAIVTIQSKAVVCQVEGSDGIYRDQASYPFTVIAERPAAIAAATVVANAKGGVIILRIISIDNADTPADDSDDATITSETKLRLRQNLTDTVTIPRYHVLQLLQLLDGTSANWSSVLASSLRAQIGLS